MASALAQRMGIAGSEEKPEVIEPIQESQEPIQTTPAQLSDEDADRIALERINKARGTSFATLDEAFAAINNPQPQPQETEEEKKKKRQNDIVKFALENNVVSAQEFEDYHRESARDAREVVFADFSAKHKANGKSDEWIQKAFAKAYGEDLEEEDENDDITPAVRMEQQERIKKDAAKILRKKYPKIHSLDKEFDTHVNKLVKEKEEKDTVEKNMKQYVTDVNEYFSNLKPVELVVPGEQGKPETDFKTEFTYLPEVVNKIKAEILSEDTMSGLIWRYNKESLIKYIELRLLEESAPARIWHAAKKYHDSRLDNKMKDRKELNADNLTSGGGSNATPKRSVLGQRMGIPVDNV